MSDYDANINSDDYYHNQPIYVQEIAGVYNAYVPIKLSLNASNFNFDTVLSDGLDFRIAEAQNGTSVLKMWIAHWDTEARQATLFFSLPALAADQSKTLWAFWGQFNDIGISNVDGLTASGGPAFLFADDFETFDSTKWDLNGVYSIVDSVITINVDDYIQAKNMPISGTSSWMIEEGLITDASDASPTFYVHRYNFYGGENEFEIQYFTDGSIDRKHNFTDGGTVATYDGTDRGLELGSYSHNYIAYVESTDYVYQGMANRDSLIDYDDSWERSVHRNTEIAYFRIYGRDASAGGRVGIDWIIAREFSPDTDPTVDISALNVPYENVPPQAIDYSSYQNDITSVGFYHASDVGGDPYRLSDNITNSIGNSWISNTTTSGNVIIDFGKAGSDLANDDYLHLDNNRVTYYNASKLSNNDADVHDRNWWECTTTSGVWAAIKFPNAIAVNSLSVWGLDTKLNGMIKNYEFYGSNVDPRFAEESDKYTLASGTFNRTAEEQTIYFTTAGHLFYYYILEAVDTYGDNVALREWAMYGKVTNAGKKVISQLRLHPMAFDSNEYYFPKNIKLYGTNDYINWTELLSARTYTPFEDYIYGRWQRYSFVNTDAYYAYRLECVDNWRASTDIMKAAEWEMREKLSELYNYRILEGSSNNFGQVWSEPGTTFDSGTIYITNNKLNVVYNDGLADVIDITEDIADMNVK